MMRRSLWSYFCITLACAQYFDPQIGNSRQSIPALGDYRVPRKPQAFTQVGQNSAFPVFIDNNPGIGSESTISFGSGDFTFNQGASATSGIQNPGIPLFTDNNNFETNNGPISFDSGLNQNYIFTPFEQNPSFTDNSDFGTNNGIGTGSIAGGNVNSVATSFTPSAQVPISFDNNNTPGTNNGIGTSPILFGNGSPGTNPGTPGTNNEIGTNPIFFGNGSPGTNPGTLGTSPIFFANGNSGTNPGTPGTNNGIGTSPILFGNGSPGTNPGSPSNVPSTSPAVFSPIQFATSAPVTSPPISPASVATPDGGQGALAPLSCHIRQCDQIITGRGLSYARALEIYQNEEYLSEADLSVIRIKRRGIMKRQKRQQDITLPILPFIFVLIIIAVLKFAILTLTMTPYGGNFDPNPSFFPIGPTGPQTGFGRIPLPGQLGGGQLPIGNSSEVMIALSLVPDGLQAVSVFPPYIGPRAYDAVGVIFREQSNNAQRRFGSRPRLSIVQRMKQAWSRYFGLNRRDSVGQGYYGHGPPFQSNGSPSGLGGQIFEDDLFGFRVRVTLVNETCTLGQTCDANGNKISNFRVTHRIDDFYDRQTGQEFSSDAPPDCRTILNPDGCVDP